MAFSFTTFMSKVRSDNTTFKRFKKTSCLDPLIAALPQGPGLTMPNPMQKAAAQDAVYRIPHNKQSDYSQTLLYLKQQLQIKLGGIPIDPVMTFDGLFIINASYWGTDNKPYMLDANIPDSLGPRSFLHRHTLSWKSSNGNDSGLAQVQTREHVKFLADTQAPPFNNIQDPDREFWAPGPPTTQACPGTRGKTSNTDDHSTKNPAIILCEPRQTGTLTAEQWYEYSNDNGLTWHHIEGAAYIIEKIVKQEGTGWTYTFIKRNWLPHNKRPFHFEVTYPVGARPAVMPADDTKVNKGLTDKASLVDWAIRHKLPG